MKLNKKLALAALGVVLSAFAIVGANTDRKANLSKMQMENIECLAQTEHNHPWGVWCRWEYAKWDCVWNGSGSVCVAYDCY